MLLILCVRTSASTKPAASANASSAQAVRSFPTLTSAPPTFTLTDFGAVGDGVTDNGPALQAALDAIGEAGGGTLFVPAGRYAIVTGVQKDFAGLAADVAIVGVESFTPVPPPTATGSELTAGLGLLSEFAPRTGDQMIAINISGLESFLLQDVSFVGTPAVETDAFITLALTDVWEATIKHSEFYGLSSLIPGAAFANRPQSFQLKQTVFLGCTGNRECMVPWWRISRERHHRLRLDLADYGQRRVVWQARYWCSVFLDQHWQCPAPQNDLRAASSHQECILDEVLSVDSRAFPTTSYQSALIDLSTSQGCS